MKEECSVAFAVHLEQIYLDLRRHPFSFRLASGNTYIYRFNTVISVKHKLSRGSRSETFITRTQM